MSDSNRQELPDGYTIEECNVTKTGHCAMHGVEVERRKSDRKEIATHGTLIEKLFERWDVDIPQIKVKVFAIFVSLTLVTLICFGSYTYTAIVVAHTDSARSALDARVSAEIKAVNSRLDAQITTIKAGSDRGEEILLDKINRVEREMRAEQANIMAKVVLLLTSDAESKEWQKGMMKQMEMLNSYLKDVVNTSVSNQRKLEEKE